MGDKPYRGSELIVIEGMGHALDAAYFAPVVQLMTEFRPRAPANDPAEEEMRRTARFVRSKSTITCVNPE